MLLARISSIVPKWGERIATTSKHSVIYRTEKLMKANLGLFLGALLALSGLAGCDGGDTTGTAGTGGTTGGSAGTGGSTGGTGGSTGGTGGSTGGMAGSGGSSSAVSCTTYCTDIAANCKDTMQQYADEKGCMGICAAIDPSTSQMGDTLGCHAYHAGTPAAGEVPDSERQLSC